MSFPSSAELRRLNRDRAAQAFVSMNAAAALAVVVFGVFAVVVILSVAKLAEYERVLAACGGTV